MTNTDIIEKVKKIDIPSFAQELVQKMLVLCEELQGNPTREALKQLTGYLSELHEKNEWNKKISIWKPQNKPKEEQVEELLREFKNRMVKKLRD